MQEHIGTFEIQKPRDIELIEYRNIVMYNKPASKNLIIFI
jgi:hypothetical protein